MSRRVVKLNRSAVAFLLCDMQEGFRPVSAKFGEVAEVCRRLCEAAKLFKKPIIVSEQNPTVCGRTIAELQAVVDGYAKLTYAKVTFSMVTPELIAALDGIKSVVLFGVETHVCVLQSALDLLELGIDVHLVVDATSSRCQIDRHFAIARLRDAGACITTAEALLFELCGNKDAEEFVEMAKLVAKASPDSCLLPGLTDLATFELKSDLFEK